MRRTRFDEIRRRSAVLQHLQDCNELWTWPTEDRTAIEIISPKFVKESIRHEDSRQCEE